MSPPLLAVEGLVIGPRAGGPPVVDQVSFSVGQGEVVALIGGSGSGKTTVSLAALGHLRPGLEVRGGKVRLDGTDLIGLPEAALRARRGRDVAYVAQSAYASFNPAFRLERQIVEASTLHGVHHRAEAQALARSLFAALRLPDPGQIGHRYPHQVSGGQLQRFMIAMALMNRPKLIVFDEPTSALDVTTQLEVLACIRQAIRDFGTAAIFVSHDLPVVAQMADRIVVMKRGRAVEQGATAALLESPGHPYTREMLEAFRKRTRPGPVAEPRDDPVPLLEVASVTASYGQRQAPAIEGVDLRVRRGEVSAVVGESGSGKTTLAKVVAGIEAPHCGTVRLRGRDLAGRAARRSLDDKRCIQIAFQSADTVLNPRHSVGRILERVLRFYWPKRSAHDRAARVRGLLEMVDLPAAYAVRLPGELSGGEKQRVNLARALAAEPDVLICDEVTSALDVVVAVEVLALIRRLCRDMDLGVLFISHDLASVCAFADRISVMSHGRIVDAAKAGELLERPGSEATRQLIEAMPELRRGWLDEVIAARAAPTIMEQA